jgi:hypothetical protein
MYDDSCLCEVADTLAALEQRVLALEPLFTPEEAEMIAAPWSYITPSSKASAPAAAPAPEPNGYAYRYPTMDGSVIRFNHGEEVNGSKPLCAIPYWLEQPPAVTAPAAEPATDELPPKVGHILRLAEIIREVDGTHDKGAAALAEAILSHPGIAEVLPPAPAATPTPAPAGSLVEVVAALIANGIACDREEEQIAVDAIAAVAERLERHHTGRIANGSQFADLLREALEREAGR